MDASVTVVDYGMGNLHSVCRAFEFIGAQVRLTDKPQEIVAADHLVLPGVGAFRNGMAELGKRRLIDPLHAFVATGRPMLGICLGMQMLLEVSDEFGEHEGLRVIPGAVRIIPKIGTAGVQHKIPHIGWNRLLAPPAGSWEGTILEGIPPGTEAYFVHSYTAQPAEEAMRLADADYDGCRISAVVRKDRIYGCQFHPEKSGPVGLQMLKNFLEIV